ncbi:MAG: nitroreductase family protein [Spirochaetales bacterium]|nr:nitroreductase family protein [Spirochaetales bacterium]
MTVKEAIQKRRAYRILGPVEIKDEILEELGEAARLAPSCYNNQPWRFIFVRERQRLHELYAALSPGNAWAKKSSLIIAVFGMKKNDCVIGDREYYLFDIGLATAQLILKATEFDMVAHPIAGFSPEKVKEILGIPADAMVITLLIIGKRAKESTTDISQKQIDAEEQRPPRHPASRVYSVDAYSKELDE